MPNSGTETITGTLTGAPAVSVLASNSNAQPSFPSLVFTGPVNTTVKGPVTPASSTAKTGVELTFVTPVGNLVVRGTPKTSAHLVLTGKSGSTCHFMERATAIYTVAGSQSTGKFVGATGSGTIVLTALIAGSLLPGKTTCSVSNLSKVIAKGTSITFKVSGPLTLKQ